jgi:hypothetical protein
MRSVSIFYFISWPSAILELEICKPAPWGKYISSKEINSILVKEDVSKGWCSKEIFIGSSPVSYTSAIKWTL